MWMGFERDIEKRGYQWIWGLEYTNKTGFSDFCIVLCANHFLGEIFRVLLMCWICNEHFSGLADIWNVHGSVSMFFIPFVPKITFNLKKISFSIRIWFISSISHLAYNLVVDEENEKEQEENPESQVQLLKQVFRQNFHFGAEICRVFFPIYVLRLKSWSPLFSWRHMSPLLFFCLKFFLEFCIWGRVANFATKLQERLFSV